MLEKNNKKLKKPHLKKAFKKKNYLKILKFNIYEPM